MRCIRCNSIISEGASFCSFCGQSVEPEPKAAEPVQQVILSDNPQEEEVTAQPTYYYSTQDKPVIYAAEYIARPEPIPKIHRLRIIALILSYASMTIAFIHNNLIKDAEFTGLWVICYAVLLAVPILFWVIFGTYCRNKSFDKTYCPKCRRLTAFNKYTDCTECNKNHISNTLARAIMATIAYILKIPSTVLNDAFIETVLAVIAFLLFLFILIIPVYMLPYNKARRKGLSASPAIFWLNIFLGFTVVFWIILLIWACSGANNSNYNPSAVPSNRQNISPEQRFAQLQQLKEMGAISNEEFERKRQEILQNL